MSLYRGLDKYMKKLILALCLFPFISMAYANPEATLGMRITNPVKNNKYFLCLYDVGCISIKAGDQGKTYPMPAMDVGNILKFVITDVDNMKETMQATNQSCNVKVESGQKLTITGNLIVQNNTPSIKNMKCHVA